MTPLIANSAAALVIGNELLTGKVSESNLVELARTLRAVGVSLGRVVIIPDRVDAIANEVRESSGGLPALKALGLDLASQGRVQVSMNLVDFRRTPLHVAFDAVRRAAEKRGIEIEGSELIGLIPQAALDLSKGHDFRWINMRSDLILETCLSASR